MTEGSQQDRDMNLDEIDMCEDPACERLFYHRAHGDAIENGDSAWSRSELETYPLSLPYEP